MKRSLAALLCVTLAALSGLRAQDLPAPVAPAQTPRPGRIVGKILEENTGTPISGAQVGVAAGGVPVTSGIDGRYTLMNVPAGPVALAIRAIGYAPKTVSGIEVPPGGVVAQDVTLSAQTVVVGEINVAAAVERGSVTHALDEQRNATGVMNSVTAEQIARSPDADAAQAVQRVSGVTVQDGRYVIVRGLGERYTTTSLNGARIPSAEPERKVVPLDLFPASLLEAVTTSKTFTVDQPGDFSGASVNLRTREFDLGRTLAWSMTLGFNSASTGRSIETAPRTGSEWFGYGGAARSLPGALATAPPNLAGVSTSDIPMLIGTFRDVWSAQRQSGAPSGSMSLSLGGEDPVLGHLIGYLGSITYSYGLDVHRGEQRAIGASDGAGGTRVYNPSTGEVATASVLWGGIANLSTRIGASTKLTFNNTYNRSGDNLAARMATSIEEFGRTFDQTRLQYVARSIRSNQLQGEHLLAQRHTLTWAVTSSGVLRDEPDRSDVAYIASRDSVTGVVTPTAWWGGPKSGSRTFSKVRESGWQIDGSWRWALGGLTGLALKVGGQYRTTDRTAETRSYEILQQSLDTNELRLAPEQLFRLASRLTLNPSSLGGRYTASDRLTAGFAMLEVPLGRRVRLIGGARVEHSDVHVNTTDINGNPEVAAPLTTDILPSLSATIDLGGNQQVRLAATQTLSRPEYRELSRVPFFEMLGGTTTTGNPNLRRALVQNFDLRWEWYPRGGEVLSVGLFGKHFDQPIERTFSFSTGFPQIGFANSSSASNYGVEVELRKSLAGLGAPFTPFTAACNATLIHSRIDVGGLGSNFTNPRRPMVGQSPYVVNASLGYTSASGRLTGTLLYNVFGRRITEAGLGNATSGVPDSYEEARSVLDLSLRYGLSVHTGLKLDARNLLDTPYRVTQGSVTRERYTVGRGLSFGVNWEP